MIILFLIMTQQWTSFLNPQPIYNIASNGENIWAATNGGILGYKKSTTDTTFQRITNTSGLPNNQIVNVAIDKYGNMWFLCASSTGGVIVMSSDISKKRLFTYTERLPSYNFSSICIDGDSVWVGTEDNTKIWLYDMKGDPFNINQQGVVLKNLQPSNEVKKIKIFEGIDIWRRYNASNSGLSNNNISGIIIEGSAKWIGTDGGGLVKFDGNNWTVFNESNSGLSDNHIRALAIEGTTGSKWIGTLDGGLVKFDGNSWVVYDTSNSGLSDNNISAIIIEDSTGVKWIGTDGGGLVKFDGTNWTVFNESNSGLSDNNIQALAIEGTTGVKWIGTDGGGLVKFDGTTWTVYTQANSGLPDNDIRALATEGSAKWIGTYGGGLAKFDGTTWAVYDTTNSGLPDNDVRILAIEGSAKWIGTDGGGLVKFDSNSWVVYDTSNSSLPNNNISGVITEGTTGAKWIGVDGGGVVKFDITKMWVGTNSGIGVSNRVFDDLMVFNNKNGLPNDTVYAIEKWNNYIWAGTKKGIARILIDSIRLGDSVLWDIVDTNFKVNDFCVVDTALWMACAQGTYRCELVGDTSCNWIQIANYDSRALLFDGTLWIGTAWNGIVKYADPIQEYKPEGPAANYFLNMAMDLDGGIWSSHWGEPGWTHNKVSKLYKVGNNWKWKVYSFSVPFVTNVMVDKSNNKWIIMADWNDPAVCAVARIFPNDSIIQITIDAPGGANFVTGSCLDENDDLWIASTDGYIRRIRSSTNQVDTAFSDPNGYTSWVCPLMMDADNNLWLGSIRPQCLVILKKDGTMQKELIAEEFYFFNKGRAGEVWVGSTSGAYQFKNMQIVNSYTISELGGSPRGMTVDSTDIWFAISKSTETDEGGIRKLSGDGFEKYTTQDGLVNDLAKSVKFDHINNILWVGTENGLSRFCIGSPNSLDTLSKIIVCPNPFMASKQKEIVFYIGSAGISGDDSGGEVRIYTLSGRLLKKIEHINSSKVVWDGKDMTGNKISSGVYLVIAFNAKTNKKYLTKFAVIK